MCISSVRYPSFFFMNVKGMIEYVLRRKTQGKEVLQMKKFISAITSFCMAATMIGAAVPATVGAADTSKSFSVKTYDISKPSAADASSTVTIKKTDIPSGGYVLPCALYYGEGEDNSTDSLLVGITTDSKDIEFKVYDPLDPYKEGEKEYTIKGSTFKTDSYISFAGKYDKLDGYSAAGLPVFGVDSSQTAAGTDNYYIGCSWMNAGVPYSWAGEKSDSYPFYVFDTIIPQNISAGSYTVKFCEYNTDKSGKNNNPSPMVEGQKQRYTTENGNLKLAPLTIKVVGDDGETTSSGSEVSFSFVDENGNSSISAKPGDEITVFANIKAGGQPVSAMDVQFKADSPVKITQIGGKSAAIGNKPVSSNIEEYRANFTAVDTTGEPLVPTDGKAAFSLVVKVPDDAAAGSYTVGFDKQCKVFKDSTNYNYPTSSTPLTINVSGSGNGGNSGGSTSSADISFSFVDENGKSSISAKPGDEITVYANIKADGKPVSAMDVQFKVGSSLKITQIGGKSAAIGNKSVSTNLDEYRANFTAVGTDGEPIVPTDGKAAFSLIVKVPDGAANGDFTVGFDSQCKVFKDSTKYNYSTAFTPLTVTVTGGSEITFKLGDVNDDGLVDAVDASMVLAEYARLSTNQSGTFTEKQKLAANVNADSTIDAVDASNILAYYAYASTATGSVKSMEDFMKDRK